MTTLEPLTANQPTLPGLQIDTTGATITGELTPLVITTTLAHLRVAEQTWNWTAGDLVLHLIHTHGPTRGLTWITQADLSQAHLARCVAVAQQIPRNRRHPNLSWSHHELVAGAPEHDQIRLLDMAVKENLDLGQLKAVIKQEYEDLNPRLQNMPDETVIRLPPAAALRPYIAANPQAWILIQPSTGQWKPADQ